MEQPVYYWDPVIAPSGAVFYTGKAFPDWRGDLLVGSLQPGRLVRLKIATTASCARSAIWATLGERIRDVRQGPEGSSICSPTVPGDGYSGSSQRAAGPGRSRPGGHAAQCVDNLSAIWDYVAHHAE